MKFKSSLLLLAGLLAIPSMAQEESTEMSVRQNWHHMSRPEGSYGVSTDSALAFLQHVAQREPKEIVIAIMDSGIDTAHEDLVQQLWVNEYEIPGNGIDDDNNGYVDDVHGWNFIGGANGNVEGETMELTRLLVQYEERWDDADMDSIRRAFPNDYALYKKLKTDFEKQLQQNKYEQAMVKMITMRMASFEEVVKKALNSDDYTEDQLDSLAGKGGEAGRAAESILALQNDGLDAETLEAYGEQVNSYVNYYLNKNWNIRDSIVGDNPNDWTDTIYGNNDLMGKSSGHGTHVAGIVGADRMNGLGVAGIAPRVRLMVLRVVPDGDERDKDVGLAIKYAVDNGASIINMSFGKDYSPDAEKVQEMARYAEEHDVLIVHAAGNDSRDLDDGENYPYMPFEESNLENAAWIEVGASTLFADELAAGFSNYGERSVDIFAPGDEIYSTLPRSKYGYRSGTSMAAPVVTGIAALIRSHYPELTAAQVKTVILESGITPEEDISDYSITGKIANAFAAVQYIEKNKEDLLPVTEEQ